MITLRPGSQTYRLLILLSYACEIPMRAIKLLGSEKSWRRQIHKLTLPQEFKIPDQKERFYCRMITVSGNGSLKTIRLSKMALPVLELVSPGAYRYYTQVFLQHNLSGSDDQIERHHRSAEAIIMMESAGLEFRPDKLPALQNDRICHVVPRYPSYYFSRELKGVGMEEENKTNFSRIVGGIFYPGGFYAVFNTRKACMKWNGRGENKVQNNLEQIARWNSDVNRIDSAILLGEDYGIALRTMNEAYQNRKLDLRFDAIYGHIHYIPMNANGMKMLRILTTPDWKQQLMDLLFDPSEQNCKPGSIEYDAKVDDVYILSHLDGDIARLLRFYEAWTVFSEPTEILCYSFQVAFLREFFGNKVRLRIMELADIENAICPNGG